MCRKKVSRYLNSSDDITRCAVPSRQCVFSLGTTCRLSYSCGRGMRMAIWA